MKYLLGLLGLIMMLFIGAYVVAFTSLGNSILHPYIEQNIQQQTKLDSKLKIFKLDVNDFELLLELNPSNTIHVYGKYSIFGQSVDIVYGVKLDKLETLKSMTGADVRGAFKLDGKVIGNKTELTIDGKSDLASSDMTFKAVLREFQPVSVKANMKNLQLAQVLYMVNQPHYADGIFSLDLDIVNAKMGSLKGTIATTVQKGLLDSAYMTKTYEFQSEMPKTSFGLKTFTKLNGNVVDTKIDLTSTLVNLNIKSAKMNLSDDSIHSDYVVKVHSLDKLFFVSQRHLRGSIIADGKLDKTKDLDLTMHSNISGGKIDVKVHNNNLHADIVGVKTVKALHILMYPEVFESDLDAKLDYDTVAGKGSFDGHIVDGKFAKNNMFTLLKRYSKYNLYKETYKGGISADINKEKIVANLDLISRKSSIKSSNAMINSKEKTIDADVVVSVGSQPISVSVKGKTDKPKISIDAKELLKTKAGQKLLNSKVGKKVQKKLGKYLNTKDSNATQKTIGNLINKFF